MDGRRPLLIVLSLVGVAVVLASVLVAMLLAGRAERFEIVVQGVELLANTPTAGQTELHAYLILRNLRPSAVTMEEIALWAWDPRGGTLFDTYVHADIVVSSKETMGFSEVSTLDGIWSEVVFKVVISGSTGTWESALTPGQPVVYTPL
jgi:hypothetical protein